MDSPLIQPGEFRQWTDSPLTQAYRQFLRDRARAIADLWMSEDCPSEQMARDQARAGQLMDLADLSVDQVRAFYGLEEAKDVE